ncbi:unnamed protein product [Colias eurytheme]|nr:unnamed protein product [Colias eurytheme]
MINDCFDTVQQYLCENTANVYSNVFRLSPSDLGGRGLFANKCIKRGSIIFVNKPLVLGPRRDRAGELFCTVCYNINDSCSPCEKCALITCSMKCKTSPEHTKECAYVNAKWQPKTSVDFERSRILCKALIYIRFLFLSDKDKQFLRLFQASTSNHFFEEFELLCAQDILQNDDMNLIKFANSILKINSFRIPAQSNTKTVPLRGLYPLSAFLNHSCVPNTRNIFRTDYTMAVLATRDIEVGEELLSCYTGLLWCTPTRRYQLFKAKQFWCKCHRCQDASEMGTLLSGLKCINKECTGTTLPHEPLKVNTDWLCTTCNMTIPIERVRDIHGILGSLLGTLDLDKKLLEVDERILDRLTNFIPSSNHILVDIRMRQALSYGYAGSTMNELSEARLSLKESLCRSTLRTLAALGLGDAHLRGLLLYHLHASLAERARRCPELYEDLKIEIESTIEQAYHILQDDISSPPDLELRHQYLGPGCEKPHEERFLILDSSRPN